MKIIASALNGPRNLLAGSRSPALLAMSLVAAVILLGACSSSDSDPGFNTPPIEEPNNFLFDVFGTDGNNVFACGARGAMFHFNGTVWDTVSMGTSKAITTIWGLPGDNTLYAVGHGGTIWRNTGSGWSGMTSGTTQDLFGIGQFDGQIHAVGFEGTILRLNGSSWGGLPKSMWILDKNGAPTDTLETDQDLASVVAVNEFFLGGAYHNPNFDGERIGRFGTKPMVMNFADADDFDPYDPPDPAFSVLPDWILRPISGEQVAPYEWVYCMTSDPAQDSRSLMGTSEGWLFKLAEDLGKKVWAPFYPSVTRDPDRGIRDIWLDDPGNIYMVTDAGTVVFQTFDYNFTAGTGFRSDPPLYDGPVALHGIWGTGPDNLFIVGNMDENTLLRASHDQETGEFTITEVKKLGFPALKSGEYPTAVDRFGEPLQ